MNSNKSEQPVKTLVILLNMGGPQNKDEIHPYLKELFQDRELLKLPFQKIIRWPQAIPLPDHKMGKRKEAAKVLENQNPGLRFSGSHLCGPPLPNCLLASIV